MRQRPERPPTPGEEFLDLLDSRLRIFLSVLVDGLLLLGGLLVLWILQRIGDRLALHGVVYWYWLAIEIILSVASILGVGFYVVNDLYRLFRRLFRSKGS